jgi:hypothetical protein
MTATEAQHALALLDRMDPARRSAALRFMEFLLLDPASRAAAAAPPDDEPVTEEDRRRLDNGHAWFEGRGGKGIPIEEVLAEFGLKVEDFPLNK